MIRSILVSSLAVFAAIAAVTAEEFPLVFKTIPPKDVTAFPGGYGAYAQLRLAKPDGLKKEPKAISQHPLYGRTSTGDSAGFIIRLDESGGDGTGYDTVLADMNQNGDLTDEAAGQRVPLANDPKPAPGTLRGLFGPYEAPADKSVAGGQPVYFAQVQVFNTQLMKNASSIPTMTYGYVRFKAGWYLEAQVALGAVRQKIGFYDADTNLRVDEIGKFRTSKSQDEENWYFTGGDSLLVDADNSGAFENDPFNREWCPASPIVYFGTAPHRIKLAADCKSVQVEAWKEALATVSLAPRGEQVQSVSLGWERAKDDWQLIRAEAAAGKIQVPPGNYRLYTVTLLGKGAPREQIKVSAYQRVVHPPSAFRAGAQNTLKCGAPLDIKVAAERKTPAAWEISRLAPKRANDSDYVLGISANISGAGGEIYSTFGKGQKFVDDPPQPAFTVVDSGGKTVGLGNLEYG